MTVISIVPPLRDEEPSHLPSFEGERVDGLKAKFAAANNLELSDDFHRLDQTARMIVTGKVTRVDHVVDERTGRLVRVETFKVIDAVEIPWNAVNDVYDVLDLDVEP